jgi:hypothetical protein
MNSITRNPALFAGTGNLYRFRKSQNEHLHAGNVEYSRGRLPSVVVTNTASDRRLDGERWLKQVHFLAMLSGSCPITPKFLQGKTVHSLVASSY